MGKHNLIASLLQAIHLPSKIAVVHSPAHTEETDTISLENKWADRTAKYAAQNGPSYFLPTQFLNLP